jgi:hypothetical protein
MLSINAEHYCSGTFLNSGAWIVGFRFLETLRRGAGRIEPQRMDVPLVPAERISNLDESRISDWEEGKPKRVIIQAECAERQFPSHVDRATRRQTLHCCISEGGDAYCPLFLSVNRGTLAILDRSLRENTD